MKFWCETVAPAIITKHKKLLVVGGVLKSQRSLDKRPKHIEKFQFSVCPCRWQLSFLKPVSLPLKENEHRVFGAYSPFQDLVKTEPGVSPLENIS